MEYIMKIYYQIAAKVHTNAIHAALGYAFNICLLQHYIMRNYMGSVSRYGVAEMLQLHIFVECIK